jgi:uncharacterized protein (DUF58 family)
MKELTEVWHRLRQAFEGTVRQQVTRIGLVFWTTVVLVGFAAFVSANNLMFLLLAALLATMLISNFVSRLGLAGLELTLIVPDHMAARRPIPATMVVRNRKFLTPSFSLQVSGAESSGLQRELYIPVAPARTALSESCELLFQRRGIYKDNTFWFSSRFPFGFTHRRAQVRLKQEVLVYPAIDAQPGFESALVEIRGEIDARQRGPGTDLYRIRPYEHMESARHVDWRATAHTGELQIREFTREKDIAVNLFLDLHVPPHGYKWFEHAVDCCAFLVWHLNERGTRVRFLTQRFDRRMPEEINVYDILRYLALVEPVPGAKAPTAPDDQDLSIAISSRAAELASEGWVRARLPSPDEYAAGADDRTGSPRTRTHIDHRNRAD